MKIHNNVYFARYAEDVLSERRTLFHLKTADAQVWEAGTRFRLRAKPRLPRCKTGVVIDVRQVHLLTDLDANLAKLCAPDREAYLASWDSIHPKLPSKGNPAVLRIEFRYDAWEDDPDDPPEWSLAS